METPTIGHNSGAALTLQEQLAEDNAALVKRTAELRAAVERVPAKIGDDATSGMIADQVKQIRDHITALTKAHETAKAPYLRDGRIVDTFFNPAIKELTALKDSVNDRNTAYLTAKAAAERKALEEAARIAAAAEREAREEAERRIAEAQTDADLEAAIVAEETAKTVAVQAQEAAAQTQVSTADLTRIHSAHGTTTSLRNYGWKHRNVDRAKLDLELLRPYLPAEAIDQAIRAYIRANGNNPKALRGVEFYEDKRAA
jgi:hypothetical protein